MWTTLRDPRTAHEGAYDAETVARLMRAVARRIPEAHAAMAEGRPLSGRLTGAILGEDPMAPEVAWTGPDGSRRTGSPEAAATLAAIRDAHGLGDPTGRTLVIESWERGRGIRGKHRSLARDAAERDSDEALLAAFEARPA